MFCVAQSHLVFVERLNFFYLTKPVKKMAVMHRKTTKMKLI